MFLFQILKNLLGQDNVICYLSTLNESILIRSDKVIHNRLESINQNFGDDFVSDITEANRSILGNKLRGRDFWDQSNESKV